jgi:signal transduction histidine kinase
MIRCYAAAKKMERRRLQPVACGEQSESHRSATDAVRSSPHPCGKHLLAGVNDILDFSRIEAGRLTIGASPFDLGRLVERAIELNVVRARSKGLTFRVTKSPDLPAACLGDEMRIPQVLVNLLSNAVKFTQRGGITLSVARVADGLLFQVDDTGIGLSAEQIAHLFNAFEQVDSATTRRFGGSGLGWRSATIWWA